MYNKEELIISIETCEQELRSIKDQINKTQNLITCDENNIEKWKSEYEKNQKKNHSLSQWALAAKLKNDKRNGDLPHLEKTKIAKEAYLKYLIKTQNQLKQDDDNKENLTPSNDQLKENKMVKVQQIKSNHSNGKSKYFFHF